MSENLTLQEQLDASKARLEELSAKHLSWTKAVEGKRRQLEAAEGELNRTAEELAKEDAKYRELELKLQEE
jgi:chromosome segregation ATPase